MKLWNSEEELDALIEEAAREAAEEEAEGFFDDTFAEETESKPMLTLIQNTGNKRGKWQDRIDRVKAEYEKELERKKALFDKTGCAGVFTPEDIAFMIDENESFNGKKVDFSKVEKWNKLAASAQWLDANHVDIVETVCPPLPSGRVGCITVSIKRVSSFNAEELRRTLAGMLLVCDSINIIALNADVINLIFHVRDIRTN